MQNVASALRALSDVLTAVLPAIPVEGQDRARIEAALGAVHAAADAMAGATPVAAVVKRSDVAAAVAAALPAEVAKQLPALVNHA